MKHLCVNLIRINTQSNKDLRRLSPCFSLSIPLHLSPSYSHILGKEKKERLTLRLHGDIPGLTSSTVLCFASSLASLKRRKTQDRDNTVRTKIHANLFAFCTATKCFWRSHRGEKVTWTAQGKLQTEWGKHGKSLKGRQLNCTVIGLSTAFHPLMLLYIETKRGRGHSACPLCSLILSFSFCVCLLYRCCSAWCDVTFIKVQPSGVVDGRKDCKMNQMGGRGGWGGGMEHRGGSPSWSFLVFQERWGRGWEQGAAPGADVGERKKKSDSFPLLRQK